MECSFTWIHHWLLHNKLICPETVLLKALVLNNVPGMAKDPKKAMSSQLKQIIIPKTMYHSVHTYPGWPAVFV